MRFFFLLHLLFLGQIAVAQNTSTFLDERDGTSYKTVELGKATWFQENIRYQTKGSFCKGRKLKKEQCGYTNYYPYTELTEVCPTGWHVATLEDWEQVIEIVKKEKGVNEDLITYDTIENNGTVVVRSDAFQIMEEATVLKFRKISWVQGNRIRRNQNTTMWINDERINDDRYHIHYGDSGYYQHTHAHHVDGPKKKRRRFAVRCVKNTFKGNE